MDGKDEGGQAAEPQAAVPQQYEYGLNFTGSGSEYFRIWIVNLALTIATLGIYSAWAKVRRMQYFYRNTLLDNCAFNFHADPKAILRGRLLALGILLAYQYTVGLSVELWLAVVTALVLGLPFLLMSALRFRLRHSSYRGLRFGFAGRPAGAYASYTPIVLMLVLPGVLAAIPATAGYAGFSMLAYLGWPFMYAGMKRYQHGNLRYAQCEAGYTGRSWGFFKTYLKTFGLMMLGSLPIIIFGAVMGYLAKAGNVSGYWSSLISVLATFLTMYLMYLLTIPYAASRIANLVWNATTLAHVRFDSRLSAAGFIRLQVRNSVLTLVTLGLYRPFAVVSVHKYRIQCLSLRSPAPLSAVIAGAAAPAPAATGDAAADLLPGFDLSW